MSDLTFDFQLAQSLYSSEEQFPINFDDAWRWLEYGTKYDAKVSFTKSGFTKSIDFISFQESSGKPQGGRPSQKDLTYIPTDKAKDHCSVTLATGTSKNDTYQQLRWYDSIVSLIQN